jgi:hypothetical protein
MVTIRFTDSVGLEGGIKIFRQQGEAVPAGEPDTYYVSERVAQLLVQHQLPFERLGEARQWNSTDRFAELRQSLTELHQGKIIYVKDPQSFDDLINAEKDQD